MNRNENELEMYQKHLDANPPTIGEFEITIRRKVHTTTKKDIEARLYDLAEEVVHRDYESIKLIRVFKSSKPEDF